MVNCSSAGTFAYPIALFFKIQNLPNPPIFPPKGNTGTRIASIWVASVCYVSSIRRRQTKAQRRLHRKARRSRPSKCRCRWKIMQTQTKQHSSSSFSRPYPMPPLTPLAADEEKETRVLNSPSSASSSAVRARVDGVDDGGACVLAAGSGADLVSPIAPSTLPRMWPVSKLVPILAEQTHIIHSTWMQMLLMQACFCTS